ncbi:MAG TPA: acyloxyacyl hydrolase [Acidobacteriaceae bacterium]|nr:acyloxyacyl hydrolase [Acidobacteriaceae bacterium]
MRESRYQIGLNIAILLISSLLIFSGREAHAQTTPGRTSSHVKGESSEPLWQFGGFFAAGFVPSYEVHYGVVRYGVELNLFNEGFEIGRMVTGIHGPRVLRGRGEAILEVIPFWLANYPRQTQYVYSSDFPNRAPLPFHWGPYQRYGASVTPALFRWNFEHDEGHRFQPWAQLGGGLLWTNHKFPLLGGSTSVINFTPQVDIGENIFVSKRRSLEFAMKFVHISNAGLGDHNPGLNITLQFSVGYSWWK